MCWSSGESRLDAYLTHFSRAMDNPRILAYRKVTSRIELSGDVWLGSSGVPSNQEVGGLSRYTRRSIRAISRSAIRRECRMKLRAYRVKTSGVPNEMSGMPNRATSNYLILLSSINPCNRDLTYFANDAPRTMLKHPTDRVSAYKMAEMKHPSFAKRSIAYKRWYERQECRIYARNFV